MCQGRRSLLSTLHASKQSRGCVCAVRRISAGHSALSGDSDSLSQDRGGRMGGRARPQVFDPNITCRTVSCAVVVAGWQCEDFICSGGAGAS